MAAEATTSAPSGAEPAAAPPSIVEQGNATSPSKSPQNPSNESPLSENRPTFTLAATRRMEEEPAARAGERLASHLDMLAETVRAIVSRVMQSPTRHPSTVVEASDAPTGPTAPRAEYSLETRQLCVDKHTAGQSFKQIAGELGMPVTSVQTIVQRTRQHGGVVGPVQRGGRPRVTDESVEATIREIVAQHPHMSARQVLDHVMATHEELPVSFETIRRRVRDCRKEMTDAIDPDDDESTSRTSPTTTQATPRDTQSVGKTRRKRGTEYTPEFRQLCVRKHENEGKSYQAIATELNVPPDSVRAIVRKAKRTGTVQTAPRSGRPRKTTELIDRVILQSVKNSQRSTAKQIQDDLATIYQVKVSCETIRRRARDYTKARLQLVDMDVDAGGSPYPPPPPASSYPSIPTPTTEFAPVVTARPSPSNPPADRCPHRSSVQSNNPATTSKGAESDDQSTPTNPASRKRKRTEYSLEMREKCVALHRDGLGYRKIGEELKMPHTTVRAIVEKVQRTGSMAPAPRSGRPRKTDEILDKVILQTVKANAKCSARMIQQELETAFSVTVSCETIRRRVKDHMRQKHLFAESHASSTDASALTRVASVPIALSVPVERPPLSQAIDVQPNNALPRQNQYQRPPPHQQQHQVPPQAMVSDGSAFPFFHLSGEPLGPVDPGRTQSQSLMDMMTAAANSAASSVAPPLSFMGIPLPSYVAASQPSASVFGFSSHPSTMQSLLRHQDMMMNGGHHPQHSVAPPSPPSMSDFVLL